MKLDINSAVKDYKPLIIKTINNLYPKVQKKYSKEDITSDCYMKLWHASENWKPESGVTFGLYLKIILENLVKEKFKKKSHVSTNSRSLTVRTDDGDQFTILDCPDPKPSPLKQLIKFDDISNALSCLDELSEEKKTIVKLHLFEDKSLGDIAIELGKSKTAVCNQYNRAISELKKKFKTNEKEKVLCN